MSRGTRQWPRKRLHAAPSFSEKGSTITVCGTMWVGIRMWGRRADKAINIHSANIRSALATSLATAGFVAASGAASAQYYPPAPAPAPYYRAAPVASAPEEFDVTELPP